MKLFLQRTSNLCPSSRRKNSTPQNSCRQDSEYLCTLTFLAWSWVWLWTWVDWGRFSSGWVSAALFGERPEAEEICPHHSRLSGLSSHPGFTSNRPQHASHHQWQRQPGKLRFLIPESNSITSPEQSWTWQRARKKRDPPWRNFKPVHPAGLDRMHLIWHNMLSNRQEGKRFSLVFQSL